MAGCSETGSHVYLSFQLKLDLNSTTSDCAESVEQIPGMYTGKCESASHYEHDECSVFLKPFYVRDPRTYIYLSADTTCFVSGTPKDLSCFKKIQYAGIHQIARIAQKHLLRLFVSC